MNEKWKKRLIASLATVSSVASMTVMPLSAFGEYAGSDGSDKLNSGLTSSTEYQNWYNTEWNNNEEMDSGKIVLTPGQDENDLNFAWYSQEKGIPHVRIATNSDMSDAYDVAGQATDIKKTNGFNDYVASNKVSINDYLTENTTYYYQYGLDTGNGEIAWSEVTIYQTHSFTNYQAVLVGDPQIGASGSTGEGTQDDQSIPVNTYAWNQTLTTALGENGIAANASFILSAGDQIDYSSYGQNGRGELIREQEYAGFLYPEALRRVPLATTIGNHESQVNDYQYHYNNPNTSGLGKTESGSDYYYSYGDTLFIVLNSNSRNVEEHRTLMNEAVASHSDAKWKVVLFHHDIYGSGSPHSDVDGANLRILFAPLMDEFNIDLCLTGHDHSYARTFQILDGKVIETEGVDENGANAYNPEGTLYIAAGSASGSKFYTLNTTKQYYIAERSNNPIPTFSTIDFSGDSLTIKTYDYNGNKYAYDVTLNKDGNATSIVETKNDVANIDTTNITSGSKARIDEALNNVNTVLDSRDDSEAINTLTEAYDATINGNNENDPLNYYAYAQGNYANTVGGTTALRQGFSTLLDKTLYQNDTNTAVNSEVISEAYNQLVIAKNEVVTNDEFNALATQFDQAEATVANAVVGNNKGEFSQEVVEKYTNVITSLKAKLDEATITKTELTSLQEELTATVNEFNSKANVETTTPSQTPATPAGDDNTTNKPGATTTNNKTNGSVKTGDNVQMAVPFAAAVISLLGIVGAKVFRKRKIEG
ncbi:metallophosphoesterase family protein [uncultured Thomasclavelia sp.]|uniref:purple acid phosphatase family protein n=1 Tax=uncultured Thomasclavelia sp. TaxID=3025759 RepID=UPI0025D5549D|nr:metallophosphoesterase family protein [uncultured Thomasclavelia sp.]